MAADDPSTGPAPRAVQKPPGRTDTRERILEAAGSVAHEVGPAHLSLDAVAERAGVSKGGLLYHFPTKQSLIAAVIERHIAAVDAACLSAEAAAPSAAAPAIGHIQAFRMMCHDKPDMPPGILPALAENPAMLEPFRVRNRRVADRIRAAGPNSALAMIAFYVVEGMQALRIFDADPLGPEERERVLDAMMALLSPPAGGRSGPA